MVESEPREEVQAVNANRYSTVWMMHKNDKNRVELRLTFDHTGIDIDIARKTWIVACRLEGRDEDWTEFLQAHTPSADTFLRQWYRNWQVDEYLRCVSTPNHPTDYELVRIANEQRTKERKEPQTTYSTSARAREVVR